MKRSWMWVSAFAGCLVSSAALAQSWPSKRVQVIVPFTALTYLAVSSGSPDYVRDRPILLTTLATIAGPFTGAIAQKFSGPVGTGSETSISTGYYKNYVYDNRLAVLQPPYFLKSDSSPWVVSSLTDG